MVLGTFISFLHQRATAPQKIIACTDIDQALVIMAMYKFTIVSGKRINSFKIFSKTFAKIGTHLVTENHPKRAVSESIEVERQSQQLSMFYIT
jgi:hypothetical protein